MIAVSRTEGQTDFQHKLKRSRVLTSSPLSAPTSITIRTKLFLFRRSHLWCLNTFSTQRSLLLTRVCLCRAGRRFHMILAASYTSIHALGVCVHERLHLSAYFSCLVSPSLTLLPPLKLCHPQLCSETDPHRAKREEAAFTRAVQQ